MHHVLFRYYPSYVKLSNDSYWILSSYQDYENDKTSEILVNGEFYRGPDLPDTDPDLNQRTCSVQITDDLTLFSFESSYIYNATRGFWEPTGENIPYHARYVFGHSPVLHLSISSFL